MIKIYRARERQRDIERHQYTRLEVGWYGLVWHNSTSLTT